MSAPQCCFCGRPLAYSNVTGYACQMGCTFIPKPTGGAS